MAAPVDGDERLPPRRPWLWMARATPPCRCRSRRLAGRWRHCRRAGQSCLSAILPHGGEFQISSSPLLGGGRRRCYVLAGHRRREQARDGPRPDRLGQVIDGAQAHRLDRVGGRGHRREHRSRRHVGVRRAGGAAPRVRRGRACADRAGSHRPAAARRARGRSRRRALASAVWPMSVSASARLSRSGRRRRRRSGWWASESSVTRPRGPARHRRDRLRRQAAAMGPRRARGRWPGRSAGAVGAAADERLEQRARAARPGTPGRCRRRSMRSVSSARSRRRA